MRASLVLGVMLGAMLGLIAPVFAVSATFDINVLPPGKNVTLPRAATVVAPVTKRILLTSTDMPQTLSMIAQRQNSGGRIPPVRLAIYDHNQERVRYVDLKPGAAFLYTFKNLTTITIVPSTAQTGANFADLQLRIESDKPLGVGH